MIFLAAANALGLAPDVCFVVEDSPSGVQAAKAAGMAAIGVAHLGDPDLLARTGADLVVTTLDEVSLRALTELGRLQERRSTGETRRRHAERPPSVWTLVYEGFDPARQGLREALCAVGNGYFVTRGALPEAQADGVHYPGTYVAGLYNRTVSQVAGRTSRTRTSSTSRTGYRCGSGSLAARGSTSRAPTSRTISSSWTCAGAPSPVD